MRGKIVSNILHTSIDEITGKNWTMSGSKPAFLRMRERR